VRLSRAFGGTLATIAVLAFVAFVGSRAVNAVILNPDFYLDALDEGAVFDTFFTSLAENPQDLTGDLLSLFEGDESVEIPSAEEIGTGTAESLDAIDASLDDFAAIVDLFRIVEPIALVAFVLAVGLMAATTFRNPVRLMRWVGGTLALAGGVTLALWFGLQGVMEELVVHVALDDAGGLAPSFRNVTSASVSNAIDNLSPSIAGPALAAAVIGLALLVISWLPSRPGSAAAGDDHHPG
jgi:hypothetical protein